MNTQVKNLAEIENDRDYLFDNIKAVLIFLVVLGHMINLSRYGSELIKTVYVFIYFFHMPAFIFISGYFSKNVDKCRETAIKNFFVPYVLLVLFTFIQMTIMPLEYELPFVLRIFSAPSGCWYLLTLFIWKLLLKDIAKLRFCIPLLYAVGLISGFSEEFAIKMSLGRLCVYSVFFMLGYFMERKHIDYIRRIPKFLSYLFLVLFIYVSKYYVTVVDIPTTLVMNTEFYREGFVKEDFIFRIIFYIIATIFIFILINLFSAKKSVISKIGMNTFSVYLIHSLIIRMIDVNTYNFKPFKEYPYLYLMFVFVASIIITYILSRDFCSRIITRFFDFINLIIFRKSYTK